jgi:uncharacterized protein HemY
MAKTTDDYRLLLHTAEAEYDLNLFVDDGDLAYQQIVAAQTKLEAARVELQRIQSGDPSHPLVRLRERSAMELDKVKAVRSATAAVRSGLES